MSTTGLEVFDRTIHKTNIWLKDLMEVVLQIYISFASPGILCSTKGASALIFSGNTFA
jgi:hypothetical protein